MRVIVTSVFLWVVLLATQIDARPQEPGMTKVTRADVVKKENISDALNNFTTTLSSLSTPITTTTITTSKTLKKSKDVGSRAEPPNTERDLKGYQYMDNSLRTVATQLLNVSNVKEESNTKDNTMSDKVESRLGLLIRKSEIPTKETSTNRGAFIDSVKSEMVAIDTIESDFDRTKNSKYNYFKTNHPGEAMVMTEEELERELALTKLMITQKKKPTTTGGLSTWILLNPPSTTVKSLTLDKSKEINNKKENEKKITLNSIKPTQSTMNIVDTILKVNSTPVLMQKNSPTRSTPSKGVTAFKQTSTTSKVDKLTSPINLHTTLKLETTENILYDTVKITTPKNIDNDLTTLKTTTKRMATSTRTPRPIITTPKTTTVLSPLTTIKISKPNNSHNTTKFNIIRKSTTKPEYVAKNPINATSKIEKVTFKPVQMITTPKNYIQQSVPMFITKLQASFNADTKSNASSINSTLIKENIPKTNITFTKHPQTTIRQKPSKTNNVLNVQLKKPSNTQTKIEIQPIKVNAPILKIEKVEETEKNLEIDSDKPIAMGDSKIDVKFVFNPELTKIVETPTESSTSSSTVTTTSNTTKRSKQKRKKNKIRRRRPSSSSSSSSSTTVATTTITTSNPITTLATAILNTDTNDIDTNERVAHSGVTEISLQESKIVPDSETSSNNTKNKKKQVQKPITSQIYSFLSRDVMPSFGVMSLVGLGLGLASYFLYPFGGTITRRNYEIEPNYKYNLNEYGGNYGQSEEEIFSKVLQGMTTSDTKYGGMKDYEKNYYRYQMYDGAYTDPSYIKRRGDIRYSASSVPIYRPDNTLPYNSKYRKNEFKYSDSSTTPIYYERHTDSKFMNNHGNADRQFVVGNIPKGYAYDNKSPLKLSTSTESIQTDFEKQIAHNLKFIENPVNVQTNFEQPDAQPLKSNEGYEEIEITPTAVAVEHGPRSLKFNKIEDSIQDTLDNKNIVKSRRKRESFIQQIPSRSEMKKMEDDNDLSNEIFDTIDSIIVKSTMMPAIVHKQIEINEVTATSEEYLVTVSDTLTLNTTNKNETSESISTVNNENTFTPTTELSTSTQNFLKIDKSSVTTVDFSKSSTASSSLSSSTHNTVEKEEIPSTIIPNTVTNPSNTTSTSSSPERFNFMDFIKKIAEIKLRVGLTVLKHASESFSKYIDNFQKKLNGEK